MQLKSTEHTYYRIAVALSSISVVIGLARELLVVSLLGFTARNDELQIYLSIFSTVALSIDGVRLGGLNLFEQMSFKKILWCASFISFPFTLAVVSVMACFVHTLNIVWLLLVMIGCYLNLITALVITYKQRYGAFLGAQIINVFPNFIMLPGVLVLYFYMQTQIVFGMICLCCLVPIGQLILLCLLKTKVTNEHKVDGLSLWNGVAIFLRHGVSMLGEQIFQLVLRATFYKFSAGYLSFLAISIRTYASLRFIFVDSYIGSKLANWCKKEGQKQQLKTFFHTNAFNCLLLIASGYILKTPINNLINFALVIFVIFAVSFYLNTLLRINYFKINRYEHNSTVVIRYGSYEIIFAIIGYCLIKIFATPVIFLMWLWYGLKPLIQLISLSPTVLKIEKKYLESNV